MPCYWTTIIDPKTGRVVTAHINAPSARRRRCADCGEPSDKFCDGPPVQGALELMPGEQRDVQPADLSAVLDSRATRSGFLSPTRMPRGGVRRGA